MISFTFLLKLSEFSVVLILSFILFYAVGQMASRQISIRVFYLLSAKEEISASFEFCTDYLSSPPLTKGMTMCCSFSKTLMYCFMTKFWEYFYNSPLEPLQLPTFPHFHSAINDCLYSLKVVYVLCKKQFAIS